MPCTEERKQARRKAGSHTTEMAEDLDEEAAKAAERYARMRCDSGPGCVLSPPGMGALRTYPRCMRQCTVAQFPVPVCRGLVDAESSSEEDEVDVGTLETETTASAGLAAAWGIGALAANPDEDVPLVNEDTSR